MGNLKRPNYRPLVFLCTLAAILICAEYSLHLMQKFKRFVLVLHEMLAEFRPSISHNITDVRLLLWTRKSPLKYNYLYIGDTVSLSTCGFDRSKETKILIHGFSDQGLTGWVKNFKKFYLDRGDYNIISVDWGLLAKSPWYTTAAKNSKQVGKLVASLITFLVSEGATYESFHVLGASLGAHVAGYVGYFCKGQIGRITGLDPSGPLFHSVHESERLSKHDALFVDIIHTAGKWVGNSDSNGHVDFYPNEGLAPQPGCEGRESLDLSCSHRKAWQMYMESIQKEKPKFFAIECTDAQAFAKGYC